MLRKQLLFFVTDLRPIIMRFFCTALNNTIQAVHHKYDNVCVFGDFNFPSIDLSGKENTLKLGSCGSVSFENIIQCHNLATHRLMM